MRILPFTILLIVIFSSCSTNVKKENTKVFGDSWMLQPFEKDLTVFPVLENDTVTEFFCPVLKKPVIWQETYVFNPAAVVKDGKVYLLFRGEDKIGQYGGTSRIGLAESTDGIHFTKRPQPVLYPDNDEFLQYEKDGGIEDPRVAESEDGTYILMYTAFNGVLAQLCVATSTDLINWKKHGLAFGKANLGEYQNMWSKSGAIVCRLVGDRMVATKINGKYWMYWGEQDIYLATSTNLIDWEPVMKEEKYGKHFTAYTGHGNYDIAYKPSKFTLKTAVTIRNGHFDSRLVEPGPPAIFTDKGIFFIYNASNNLAVGDSSIVDYAYTVGQVLFDPKDPAIVIKRCDKYFLKAEAKNETSGQMNNTAFIEGMVHFKGKWIAYYTMGEAQIGAAVCGNALSGISTP